MCLNFVKIIPAKEYPRCKNSDTECIAKAFNEVLRLGKNGIKEINIPSFEPLRVSKIDIIQDGSSNIAINLVLHDADIYGISNANIYKIVYVRILTSANRIIVNILLLLLVALIKIHQNQNMRLMH